MQRRATATAVRAVLLMSLTITAAATDPRPWKLAWSDEFDGRDGSPPDPSKWTLETGGDGWGNDELQYYTARLANAQQRGGKLILIARRETFTGTDGVTRDYTSARLKTEGKFTQTYGRFEARMKLPRGQGIWPAFWMLGAECKNTGWPECGEIDIMENVGSKPSEVLGSLHGPAYFGEDSVTARYVLAGGKRFSDGFHLFAVEWEPGVIRFYVDDVLYATRTPASLPRAGKWVFDHPFFLLVNVAVGGGLPGQPDRTTPFPQVLAVDYVRVYQRR